jgi:hypothetical protein
MKPLSEVAPVCVMNSLKCPESKSLSHCLTELFLIYQNKHWTIRRRNDRFVNPPFHRNLLKIDGFLNKIALFKWEILICKSKLNLNQIGGASKLQQQVTSYSAC